MIPNHRFSRQTLVWILALSRHSCVVRGEPLDLSEPWFFPLSKGLKMLRASRGCGEDEVRMCETSRSRTDVGCHFNESYKPFEVSSFPTVLAT